MLTHREKKILKKIYDSSPNVYTSETLSVLFNVSSRTIKNDLENIRSFLKQYGVKINSERGKGYWLSENNKGKLSEKVQFDSNLNSAIEDFKIIEFLLFRKKYIPIYELADQFYYSESIILKKIDKINNLLKGYKLKIIKETGRGIKLIGNEKNQRIMYSQILKNNNVSGDRLSTIKDNYLQKYIKDIKNVLLEFQRKHDIGLSDVARTGLIIDISVMLNRIETNENIQMNQKEIEAFKKDKEWYYALDLTGMLEDGFNIRFTESEVSFLSIHLLSANLTNNRLPSTVIEIDEQIDSRLSELISKWIRKLDKKFSTNLSNDISFISALALHIKPLLQRLKFHLKLANPWVEDLKEEHKQAYEMAIMLAQEIKNEYKKPITDNEIAYLAMHIGGALQKERKIVSTTIICASGIGTSNFLKARLKKIYPELKIEKIISSFDNKIENINDNLIISTIPIHTNQNNVIHVTPLLNEKDKQKIDNYLNKSFATDLDKYFKKENFIHSYNADSKIDVIKKAADELYRNGYVKENYYSSVLEREVMSGTAVGNLIAIPHAFSGAIIKQGVHVTILKEAIEWDDNLVQIVFTLALDASFGEDFTDIFEKITEFRDDLELINKALKITEFKKFKLLFNGR